MRLFKHFLKSEKGISLVELIVTIAIMSIVSVGIGAAILSTTKSYSSGSTEVGLQQEVQNITNILNNLVIDAKFASNLRDDGSKLIIQNTDDEFYIIECSGDLTGANGKLVYQKIIPDDAEGFVNYISSASDVAVGYTADGEEYTLSENVNRFVATPGISNGQWDYTVSFDLGFQEQAAGTSNQRNMNTAFVASSRNGEAIKLYEENDGAVIVVDKEFVIEPYQTIKIPFEVLISGDRSSVGNPTFDFVNLASDSSKSVSCDITKPEIEKYISISAGANQVSDIEITISVSSPNFPIVSETVFVRVRRVNGISGFDNPELKPTTDSYAKAGSEYIFKPVLSVSHGDRFFALPSDDDYVSPYQCRVELEKTYSGNVTFKIKKRSDDSDVDTKVNPTSPFNIDYRENYFSVTINEDLDKGECITIRTIAEHAGLTSTGTSANNKTGTKYDFISDEYRIEVGLFPNAKFHRGSESDKYFNINMEEIKTDNILNTYIDQYLNAREVQVNAKFSEFINNGGSWILSGKTWAEAKQNYLDWNLIPEIKNKLKDNAYSIPFYSIGYKYIDDLSKTEAENYQDFRNTFTTPDKNNNYIKYDDLDWSQGYYWSQYRPLGGVNDDGTLNNSNTQIEFKYDKSYRLDADKEYSVEFVQVLIFNSYKELLPGDFVGSYGGKTILWPYYPKLLDAGFGDAGYSFDSLAEEMTGGYVSYANHFEVGKAAMQFKEDYSIGVGPSATSIGTETSPLYFGSLLGVGSSKDVEYDNWERWEGLGHNMFINHNSYSIDAYYGGTWNNLVTHRKKSDGEFTSALGGFGVGATDHSFYFKNNGFTPGTTDSSVVFRMTCSLEGVNKTYIRDSDGVFSKKIYTDTNTYNYDYPPGNGVIYFKMY